MKHFLSVLVVYVFSFSAAFAESVTAPLSEADVSRYQKIFTLQEDGKWQEADKLIAQLNDRMLMGHVLHQRYMHPTAYRSQYTELKRWLDAYADHPNADVIYRLSTKRRPSGEARPKRYQTRRWRTQDDNKQLHPDLEADYARISRPADVRRIEGKVRWHCHEDEPTQALNYISASAQRNLMTKAQYDRMRSWIAESYYYNNKIDKAWAIATDVARDNGDKAPLAYWTAGLISWRRGDVEKAADYFSKMADVEWQENSLRAAAGFWAARAMLASGEYEDVTRYLNIAAAYPYTLYGQLALGKLGQSGDMHFSPPDATMDEWTALARKNKRILRAAALAQVGQETLAHTELRWAHGELEDEDDKALMAFAFELDLWAAQIDMAIASGAGGEGKRHLEAGLYPLPDYTPNGGFKLDKAVLFGMIRQESKFKTDAQSRVGAAGLMQLMPRTAAYVSGDRSVMRSRYRASDKLYEPGYNMQLGQSYIEYLLDGAANNDLLEMAIAYNWGPGNLRRWKNRTGIEDELLMIETIPNPEARDFVDHVLTNIWVYRARLGEPAPSRDSLAAGGKAIYQSVN